MSLCCKSIAHVNRISSVFDVSIANSSLTDVVKCVFYIYIYCFSTVFINKIQLALHSSLLSYMLVYNTVFAEIPVCAVLQRSPVSKMLK